MPGLKSKGGFGDLRALGRGIGIVGSGKKEEGVGLDKVQERRTTAETRFEDGSRVVAKTVTRTEGALVGKRKVASVETGTRKETAVGGRTEIKMRTEMGTETGNKTGVGKRKESGAGVGSRSGLGVESASRNGTGVRRNSVIGSGIKTGARTGFGGPSGFTAELMKSTGSVLKKRRQSISSQFYY